MMLLIILVYLTVTGFISSKITGGGYKAIIIWFFFIYLWNKFSKYLPPVELYDTRNVTERDAD